jgi:hypothetical protein
LILWKLIPWTECISKLNYLKTRQNRSQRQGADSLASDSSRANTFFKVKGAEGNWQRSTRWPVSSEVMPLSPPDLDEKGTGTDTRNPRRKKKKNMNRLRPGTGVRSTGPVSDIFGPFSN